MGGVWRDDKHAVDGVPVDLLNRRIMLGGTGALGRRPCSLRIPADDRRELGVATQLDTPRDPIQREATRPNNGPSNFAHVFSRLVCSDAMLACYGCCRNCVLPEIRK